MKAEIKKGGYVCITAENIAEAFALKYLNEGNADAVDQDHGNLKFMVDCSVLNTDKSAQKA